MGFYLELDRRPTAGGFTYREKAPPPVFWVLYAFSGFALACMGLAAHGLLGDLAASGAWYDRALVGALYACVPGYVALGLWLALVRRYVTVEGGALRLGRTAGTVRLWERSYERGRFRAIALVNRKPTPNYATMESEDGQYFVKGHWRLVAWLADGGAVTLDKHTDREALTPMLDEMKLWLK